MLDYLNEYRLGTKRLGTVTLKPSDARDILRELRYTNQRNTNDVHVFHLTSLMKAERWTPLSMITFSRHKGALYLVDGQHRLRAQGDIEDGSHAIEWAIRILEQSPGSAYGLLDTIARARSDGTRMLTLGIELEGKTLANCNAAAAFILANDTTHTASRNTRGIVAITERDDYVRQHERIFQRVAKTIGAIDKNHRPRLYSPTSLALLVATILSRCDEAVSFWSDLTRTSNGTRRRAADLLLLPRPEDSPPTYYTHVLAAAWNQRHNESDEDLAIRWTEPTSISDTTLILPASRKRRKKS